ncbi:hypothetical protein GGC64_002147 [Mycobacterium sp. OAS707]|uniref:DUF6997 domain-containing protein n=1 Tax=Mycobacterium sp. OAS707 TaxID=2663822 RepID=UPI0017896E08|nr:hypothetical protein [Mycobacterium sp. OAS707]MBE1548139.1 hypothetical protein [Mycobacterium sp. OAS707]
MGKSGQPGVFHQALEQLGDEWVLPFGSFDEYKRQTGFSKVDTASAISIQTLASLNPELRAREVMVFRYGSPKESRTTRFALAKAAKWPDDYFILDRDFDAEPPIFLSKAPLRELFAFGLLKPSERALVNVALTTGALASALEIDDLSYGPPGATGGAPYSFRFQPHSSDGAILSHDSGQVEIDLLLVAERRGSEAVFVIEAKRDDWKYGNWHSRSSLAKTKLLFPVLAIAPQVPSTMKIVPVYLKISVRPDGVDFHVAECEAFTGGENLLPCVDQMTVVRRKSLRLREHALKANWAV